MPVHDWTRVDAGVFHHFHHSWIEEIKRALNRDGMPSDYYAMAEQHAAGFGPDVLTLQSNLNGENGESNEVPPSLPSNGGLAIAAPKVQPVAETDMAFYRRKQNTVTVRHVSGDRVVAIVEIVSPGNKAARNPLRAFVDKAAQLLDQGIHLLIVDLFPPGRRDPQGIHGEIWEGIAGQEYEAPKDKPLTQVSYESGLSIKAYVVHMAVGDELTEMPLFLEPNAQVPAPLEKTYQQAWEAVPRRWQRVLEATAR